MYQGRNYSVAGNATNTSSSTLPLVGISGATSIRPAIYEFQFGGQSSPSDNAAQFLFQRATTIGNGTANTPDQLEPSDPASITTATQSYTTGPTLTANAFLYEFALNERATYRWVAGPGSEMRIPATAANGIMCLNPSVSATWTVDFTLYFTE